MQAILPRARSERLVGAARERQRRGFLAIWTASRQSVKIINHNPQIVAGERMNAKVILTATMLLTLALAAAGAGQANATPPCAISPDATAWLGFDNIYTGKVVDVTYLPEGAAGPAPGKRRQDRLRAGARTEGISRTHVVAVPRPVRDVLPGRLLHDGCGPLRAGIRGLLHHR